MSKPHKSPGLLDLPVEIVLYILQAADSLSDLKSLILTAPSFNNVWKVYTASISRGVLGRNIECLDEILNLEKAVHPKLAAGFGPALERVKRITSAACLASSAYEDYIFIYSRISFYQDLLVPCGSGREEFCLRDPENRRSFKRSFYCLWMLVITSEYKPLVPRQPLNPFPLQRKDVLSLCELAIWILSHVTPAPSSLFRKASRIYNLKDHVRCLQNRRWELCCISLWQQPHFGQIRREHWSLDLGLTITEPSQDISSAFGYPLVLFLADARKAHSSLYQDKE
ncbi:MAG: hypothetical protein HETSPECPRED_001020 [Heterodermia speciosa]|uniref:F-box domain-containing protein n=1 Tax=Heterodermia speciosa TaxID=116794 RepID=A0A8H3J0E2_9LECA|nr:MAG: hypothetical protein HETSPECPRED_001020 [Heterodermia speciosa]